MPIHDWTEVEAGVFHAFHHGWIEELSRTLNRRVLPSEYYALPEQHGAGFGPDVLTLQSSEGADGNPIFSSSGAGGTALLVQEPRIAPTAETDLEYYRRKQSQVVVRHVSEDRIIAMIEVVSPGNKSSNRALRALLQKAGELLQQGIHLLVVDLFPPGPRDPQGIHAAIWDEVAGQPYTLPAGPARTLAAYETDLSIRAYVQTVGLGEKLPDMPLFLEARGCVQVPLEATYEAAFNEMPRRWRNVLQPPR